MVMAMNIDFINREVAFGAPSTQWWTQLSSAIAGGLAFATVLTLLLTPCLLVLGANVSSFFRKKFGDSGNEFPELEPVFVPKESEKMAHMQNEADQ